MSRQDKTLVILTPAFPSEEEPTWLPSQADFVRALNRLYPHLRVVILAFHFPVVRSHEYGWNGNRVITFNGGMKGKLRTLLLWRRVWHVLKQLKANNDLLGLFSFFCSESAFVGHHFAKRYRLRHYIWVLGQDARKDNNKVKRIKPDGEELIAISDFLVREFKSSHGFRPGHMIPIGVSPADFTLNLARDIDVLGAGSLSAIKQYDVFIWVVGEIRRAIPHVRAAICGHGSEYNVLKAQIEDNGLQDHMELTGGLPRTDLLQTMQRSRVFLHPSEYEGFGMVCAEALAAGAHVISFCQPLDSNVDHWHIVATKEEMVTKAIQLLTASDTRYYSVVPNRIEDTAAQIMQLYHYIDAPTMPVD